MSQKSVPPFPIRRSRAWIAGLVGGALVLSSASFGVLPAVASTGGTTVTAPVKATLSPLSADGTASGQLKGKIDLPTLLGDYGDYTLAGITAPDADTFGNGSRAATYPAGPVDGIITDAKKGKVDSDPGRGVDIAGGSDEIVRTPTGLRSNTDLTGVVIDIKKLNDKVGAVLGREEIARVERVHTVSSSRVDSASVTSTTIEGLSLLGEAITLTNGRLPEAVSKTQVVKSNEVIALLRSLGIKEEDIGQYAGLVSSSSLDGVFTVTASTPAESGLRIVASLQLRIKATLSLGLGGADLSANNVVFDAVFARTTATSPTAIAPRSSTLDPRQAEPGQTVTLAGIGYVVGGTVVTIGGAAAEVTAVSADGRSASVVVPFGLSGGTYPVVVTTAGGENSAGTIKVLADDVVPLKVTGVTPAVAQDGAEVVVQGAGFVPGFTSAIVKDSAGAERIVRASAVRVAESGLTATFALPEGIALGATTITLVSGAESGSASLTVNALDLGAIPSSGTASVTGITATQKPVALTVDNSSIVTWSAPTIINPAGPSGTTSELAVGLPAVDSLGHGTSTGNAGAYSGTVTRELGTLTANASTGAYSLAFPAYWKSLFNRTTLVAADSISVQSSASASGASSNTVNIQNLTVLGNPVTLVDGRLATAQEFSVALTRDEIRDRTALNGVFFSDAKDAYKNIKSETYATLWVRVEPVAATSGSGQASAAAFQVVADLQYQYYGENGGLAKTRVRHGSGNDRSGQRVNFYSATVASTSVQAPAAVVPGVLSVTPNVLDAGTTVTVAGRGFTADSSVLFDGVAVTPFGVKTDGSQLTFVVPAGTVAGGHTVTVTTAAGTSNARIVTVSSAPVIIDQPESVTIQSPRTVAFVASADGEPAPTVQWQREADGVWANIAGATAAGYSFDATVADNGARFRAVFTNAKGSATSQPATLSFEYAPIITAQPSPLGLVAGSTATFSVGVNATPAAQIAWQIDRGAGWVAIAGGAGSTVTFTAQARDHQARVRAVVQNSIGTTTSEAALLEVSYAPTVTAQPAAQSVKAGVTATFIAAASGNPVPDVRWQFRQELGGAWTDVDSNAFPSAVTTTLSLPSKVSYDGMLFRAVFTNGIGEDVITGQAQLTVTPVAGEPGGTDSGFASLGSPLKAGITPLVAGGKAVGGALSGLINAELSKGAELGEPGTFALPELGTPVQGQTLEKTYPAGIANGPGKGDMDSGTSYGETTVRNIWDAEGIRSSVTVESFSLNHLAIDDKGRIGALLGIGDLVKATGITASATAPADNDSATAASARINSLWIFGEPLDQGDGFVNGRITQPIVKTLTQKLTDIPTVLRNAGVDISDYFSEPLIGEANVTVTVTVTQPTVKTADTAFATGLHVTAKASVDINLSTQGSDKALVETVALTTNGLHELFEVSAASTAAARNNATLPQPGDGGEGPVDPGTGPDPDPSVPLLPIEAYKPTATPDRVILTVTQDPATSRVVTWRTDETVAASVLEYRPAAGGATTAIPAVTREAIGREGEQTGKTISYLARSHTASVNGLLPETKYSYRVGDGASNWSEWFEFTTAAATAKPFSFLYVGDAQNDLRAKWGAAMRSAYAAFPDASLVLHAGDQINNANNDVQWGEWFGADPKQTASVDQLAIAGNHEFLNGGLYNAWGESYTFPKNGPVASSTDPCTRAYEEKIASTLSNAVYYVDYQGVRFVTLSGTIGTRDMIPSSEALVGAGCTGDVDMISVWTGLQARWLDATLESNPGKWSVVSIHQPIFSTSTGRDNGHLRSAYLEIIERHNVDLVLQGHDHTYGRGHLERNEVAGKPGLQTGPVYAVSVLGPKAYDLDKSVNNDWSENGANRVTAYEKVRTYQNIEINGGHLTYSSHRYGSNEVVDSFEICKNATGGKLVAEAGVTLPTDCAGTTDGENPENPGNPGGNPGNPGGNPGTPKTPTPIPDAQLTDTTQGNFEVISTNGSTVTVSVGAGFTGGKVGIFVHSTPTFVGWFTPDANGRFSFQLPASLDGRTHKVVAVGGDGKLLGWAPITIANDGGKVSVLSSTGAEAAPWALAALALLLLGGLAVGRAGFARR